MSTIAKLVARAELDHSGFDRGIVAMGNSVDKLEKVSAASTTKIALNFAKIGAAAMSLFKIISIGSALLVLSPLVVALFAILALIGFAVRSVTAAFNQTKGNTSEAVQKIKNAVLELKVAFANAFLPLITFALPAILAVINWLTRMLNLVSMIVAAWLGQKQVMQVVIGSVKNTTTAMNNLKKATLGALAAFDQLDVLRQPIDESTLASDALAPGVVGTEMVDISDKVLVTVGAIKAAWEELKMKWFEAMAGWGMLWDWIVSKWDNFKLKGREAWDEFLLSLDKFKLAWDEAWAGFVLSWENFKIKGREAWDEFILALDNFGIAVSEWWLKIKDDPNSIWNWNWDIGEWLVSILALGIVQFAMWWFSVKNDPNSFWNWKWDVGTWIKSIFHLNALSEWWTSLKDDPNSFWNWNWDASAWLTRSFGAVSSWISTNITNPIQSAFDNVIDGIYDSVVRLLGNLAEGINGIIDDINSIGSFIPGWQNIQAVGIPHLAEGAVIPPNSQFAAVLGDQKSGNNIEAPEDLIRQIVREETGNMQVDMRIEFAGSLSALIRELKPYIDKESVRVGTSLVRSRAVLS